MVEESSSAMPMDKLTLLSKKCISDKLHMYICIIKGGLFREITEHPYNKHEPRML